MLSGYWVGGSVLRGVRQSTFQTKKYAISRLTRLWIVLIPAILLTQIVDRIGSVLYGESDVYAGSAAYHTVLPIDGTLAHLGPLTTLGNLFFVQGIHVSAIGTNTPLWSLANEFWYYLIFPAAVVAIASRVATRWRIIAVCVFLVGGLIAGGQVMALFPTWLAGATLAWFEPAIRSWLNRHKQRTISALRWTLGVVLFGGCALTVAFDLNQYVAAAIVGLLTSAFLASLITDVQVTPLSRLTIVPLGRAAEWSYSLYATHVPVIAFVSAALISSASARWEMAPSTLIAGIGVILIASLAAVGMYLVFERQTNRVRQIVLRGASTLQEVSKNELRGP